MKLSVLLGKGRLLSSAKPDWLEPRKPTPEPSKPAPEDKVTALGKTFDQLVREHPESQDMLFLDYFALLDTLMRNDHAQ